METDITEEAKNFWKQEKNKKETNFETLVEECGKYCYLSSWNVIRESSLNITEQEMENLFDSWFN